MSDPYAETDEWPTPVLPAQISTERDFPCCEVRRDDTGATKTATWRDRGRIIADLIAERDEARAEVERLTGSLEIALGHLTEQGHPEDIARYARLHIEAALAGRSRPLILMERRAESAEAEVRDLRAKVAAVEALLVQWPKDRATYPKREGYAYTAVKLCEDELRTALASVGRTEPEGARDWLDVRGDNITFPDPHDYGRTEPAPEAGGE